MKNKHLYTIGSGNVFEDIGLPNADELLVKADLTMSIEAIIKSRKLTQTKAGSLMGVSQPEVSRLFKGRFREYSVDRLMTFLTAFDRDVEIVSRPSVRGQGERGSIRFRPVST